jgi:hypothetical protein
LPPVRSQPLPTGTIPAGISNVEIALLTDEIATCRYSSASGTAYDSMSASLATVSGTVHTAMVTGLSDSTAYSFFVRCRDRVLNTNTDDFTIRFTIGAPLPAPGTGSSGNGGFPYPAAPGKPLVTIQGMTVPSAEVTVLKDGSVYRKIQADGSGSFQLKIMDVGQGNYTFAMYAIDKKGRKSQTYATNLTLVSATANVISGIILPPTIELEDDTLAPGTPLRLSGSSSPSSTIVVHIRKQDKGKISESGIIKRETGSDASGNWDIVIETRNLDQGTYDARATAQTGPVDPGNFTQPVYFGIGTKPSVAAAKRGDVDGDGKVNLVDFSVFLFNLGRSDSAADFNGDNRTDLTDFSILLFNWTG